MMRMVAHTNPTATALPIWPTIGQRGGVGMGRFRARMVPVMLLADSFEDPEHARIIYLAAGGLVVVALLVVFGTVWWWRTAAVEHPALGPLEVMGTKSFLGGDHSERRSRLDSVRPDGAEPGDESMVVPDPVDLLEADRTRPLDFDDLLAPADEEVDDEREDEVAAHDEVPAEVKDDWRRQPEIRRPDIRRDGVRRDEPVPTRSSVPMDPLMRRPDGR